MLIIDIINKSLRRDWTFISMINDFSANKKIIQ